MATAPRGEANSLPHGAEPFCMGSVLATRSASLVGQAPSPQRASRLAPEPDLSPPPREKTTHGISPVHPVRRTPDNNNSTSFHNNTLPPLLPQQRASFYSRTHNRSPYVSLLALHTGAFPLLSTHADVPGAQFPRCLRPKPISATTIQSQHTLPHTHHSFHSIISPRAYYNTIFEPVLHLGGGTILSP